MISILDKQPYIPDKQLLETVKNENTTIDSSVIKKLLVHDAKITASVTSAEFRGALTTSSKIFIIFPIIIEELLCAKAAWIIDILIKPGHKNVMKDMPKISPLYCPIERFRTAQSKSV